MKYVLDVNFWPGFSINFFSAYVSISRKRCEVLKGQLECSKRTFDYYVRSI
jgi:hypothetical protein